MKMIYPATGWFKIVEIPMYDLDDVTGSNYEYIDKSSDRVCHLFNNTWLIRYLRPLKVVFDNGSELKQDFTPLQKYLDIKPILTTIKNPQANSPVERVHQVILNILVTKDLDKKVFDHIDPSGENLTSIEWSIRAYYHCTIMTTPGQAVFVRDMIFNLASVVDWRVITAVKQQQVDIYNVQ